MGANLFQIPAQSPDLNLIENIFHLVKRSLKNQAKRQRITNEMPKCIHSTIKNKGS